LKYIIISFSHKNSNVTIREKFAFNDEQKKVFMQKVLDENIAKEIIYLSTCNRVELFLYAKDSKETFSKLYELFESFGVKDVDFSIADIFVQKDAIKHLFEVVSSLDSLVVGETQISGQVKDSFIFSYENGFCKKYLLRAMHKAFSTAGMVRKQTTISQKPVSIASVAVAKAKEIMGGNLGGFSALVVGTGEMSSLVAKHLARLKVNVIVFNRNKQKAKELADELGSTATSAKEPIITNDMIEKVDFKRYWFDIAVPRDIDENIADENIEIFVVDDLKEIANKNKSLRDKEAKIAQDIINEQTKKFFEWIKTLSVDPLIKHMRDKAKEVSLKEIEKAIKKGYIPAKYEKNVEKFVHSIFNKFLHDCTVNLKEIASTPQADTIVQSLRKVLGLEQEGVNEYKCEYKENK